MNLNFSAKISTKITFSKFFKNFLKKFNNNFCISFRLGHMAYCIGTKFSYRTFQFPFFGKPGASP